MPGKKIPTTKQAKNTPEIKEPETREEKFRRLANRRVPKALNVIRTIGNLAAYKPTDQQTDAIMEALGGACAQLEQRLRMNKPQETTFAL